jgi:membrane protein implicated in regulation of membrane protease activity
MSIFRSIQYPDRPYYATRDFIFREYKAKRTFQRGVAALLSLILAVALLLGGEVRMSLGGILGIVLAAFALFFLTLMINQLSRLLNQNLVAREYIERCFEFVAKYDEDTLETIEKMAQNDTNATQISTTLATTALGAGLVLVLANLLPLEHVLVLSGFVALVIPLILLSNSEQDSVNVVIRQAVALRLDAKRREKSELSSEDTPNDKHRGLTAV